MRHKRVCIAVVYFLDLSNCDFFPQRFDTAKMYSRNSRTYPCHFEVEKTLKNVVENYSFCSLFITLMIVDDNNNESQCVDIFHHNCWRITFVLTASSFVEILKYLLKTIVLKFYVLMNKHIIRIILRKSFLGHLLEHTLAYVLFLKFNLFQNIWVWMVHFKRFEN